MKSKERGVGCEGAKGSIERARKEGREEGRTEEEPREGIVRWWWRGGKVGSGVAIGIYTRLLTGSHLQRQGHRIENRTMDEDMVRRCGRASMHT